MRRCCAGIVVIVVGSIAHFTTRPKLLRFCGRSCAVLQKTSLLFQRHEVAKCKHVPFFTTIPSTICDHHVFVLVRTLLLMQNNRGIVARRTGCFLRNTLFAIQTHSAFGDATLKNSPHSFQMRVLFLLFFVVAEPNHTTNVAVDDTSFPAESAVVLHGGASFSTTTSANSFFFPIRPCVPEFNH